MSYVNTSPLQSFVPRQGSHIIIAIFISHSDLSMYGLGKKIICWKLKVVGTLIKIGIHKLMEHEQEKTIQKSKSSKH